MPASTSRSDRHRKTLRRKRLAASTVITLVLAALAISAPRVIDVLQEPEFAYSDDPVALSEPFAIDDIQQSAGDRPDYRYSVISGGAYNSLELGTAMRNDAVVAAHYAQVDPSRVRAERVTRDRLVYVSYRKGDGIFWTRNKVLLRQGETILTDGRTVIRAKCGNCISEQPLLPTSEGEPDVVEFDRLTEPTAPSAGDPAAAPMAWLSPAVAPQPPTPSSAALPGSGAAAQALPEMPLASGPAATGPSTPLAASTRGAGASGPGNVPVDVPGPGKPGEPGPSDPFDPFDPFDPGDELFPGPPVVPWDNPFPPPDVPPPGTPGDPTNPVSVPEPGTLLLMGAGALEIARRLRSRARQRAARKPEDQFN